MCQVLPFDHRGGLVGPSPVPFTKPQTPYTSSGFMSEDDAGANKYMTPKFISQTLFCLTLCRYSTVLLKLAPGQEVSFEFIARRGIGKVLPALRLPHSLRSSLQPPNLF